MTYLKHGLYNNPNCIPPNYITPASSPHKPNNLFDFHNLPLNQAIAMDSTALPWSTTDYPSRL